MEGENISLYENRDCGHTKVSNYFIDHFMTNANEAQIKIYLFLLRSVSSGKDISLPLIADRFNYTERDIIRSLIYWDKQGLITLDYDENRNVRGICLNVVEKPVINDSTLSLSGIPVVKQDPAPAPAAPARPFYPADRLQEFKRNPEVKSLLFTAEQYLKRTLSSSDLSSILFLYDGLHFDAGLIEFLIEYCVSSGHKNMHYIESVAHDWDERGIRTVEQAKYETNVNRREYYEVLKAFGLSGRNPVKPEIDFIRRWRDEYGFSSELIIEAVNRTMSAISKPSFQYADSILQRWKKNHVSKMSDIAEEDRAHENAKKEKDAAGDSYGRPSPTKFQNFHERDYDFTELEKRFARN